MHEPSLPRSPVRTPPAAASVLRQRTLHHLYAAQYFTKSVFVDSLDCSILYNTYSVLAWRCKRLLDQRRGLAFDASRRRAFHVAVLFLSVAGVCLRCDASCTFTSNLVPSQTLRFSASGGESPYLGGLTLVSTGGDTCIFPAASASSDWIEGIVPTMPFNVPYSGYASPYFSIAENGDGRARPACPEYRIPPKKVSGRCI
jgi:hypothetical protein